MDQNQEVQFQPEEEQQFLPEEPQLNQVPDILRRQLAAEAAMVDHKLLGQDGNKSYADAYDLSQTQGGAQTVRRGLAERYLSKMGEEIGARADAYVSSTDMSLPDNYDFLLAAKEAQTALENERETPQTPEKAVADAMDFDSTTAQQQMFKLWSGKRIMSMLDDASWMTWGREIASGLILPTKKWDASQLFKSSWFTTLGAMENFVKQWSTASPKDKMQAWPALEKRVLDSFDNKVGAASFLAILNSDDPISEWKHVEAWDYLGAGLAITPILGKMAQSMSLARVAAANKKLDDAANLVAMAAENESARASMHMTPEEVVATAHPFDLKNIFPGQIEGISGRTVEKINDHVNNVITETTRMKNLLKAGKNDEFLEKEFLTKDQQDIRIADELQRQEEMGLEYIDKVGGDFEDLRVISRDGEGFTIGYKLNGEDVLREVKYTLDDETGSFATKEMNWWQKLYFPATKFQKDPYFVSTATRAGDQSAKIFNNYYRAVQKAIGPIKWSKKSRDKVDAVLQAGDEFSIEAGKVYTPHELMVEGVQFGDQTIRLTEKETQAYYGMRRIFDDLHDEVNHMVYRRKFVNGEKDIELHGENLEFGTFKDPLGGKPESMYMSMVGAKRYLARVLGKEVKDLTPDELSSIKAYEHEGTKGYRVAAPAKGVIVRTSGRPYEDAASARMAFKNEIKSQAADDSYINVYDPRANGGKGGVIKVFEGKVIDDAYEEGLILAKMSQSNRFADGTAKYALIKGKTAIKELSYNQLHKRPGYLPKLYPQGSYFVTKTDGDVSDVLRVFDSRSQAELYRQKMIAKHPKSLWNVKADREMSFGEAEDSMINSMGGPFLGTRSRNPILFGMDGTRVPRASTWEAMDRNMKYVSGMMPINEWRLAMQKRWFNTAHEIGVKLGTKVLRNPKDFNSDILLPKSSKEYVALDELRKEISDVLHIPTKDERIYEAVVRSLAETMEGKFLFDTEINFPVFGPKTLRKSVLNMAHTDPFSMARSAAFHTMLGMYNFSQYIVQAQGAMTAMAIAPLEAPKAFGMYVPLRFALNLNHKSGRIREALDGIAKAMQWNEAQKADFLELVSQFRKSGMADGIKMNADMAAMMRGTLDKNAVSKILDNGLMFYREGELFNRAFTFTTARMRWMKNNPGKVIDDEALKAIIDDSYRMGMNFQRANRAHWQKGVLSLPTQFSSVYWKFLGNLTGKHWTPWEKVRIMLLQGAAFGAAGVPGSKWVIDGAMKMAGMNDADVSDDWKKTINWGFFGGDFLDSIGMDVDVAKRLAFLGTQDNFIEKLLTGDKPFLDVFLGPFLSVAQKTGGAAERIAPIVARTAFNAEETITPKEWKIIGRNLASITSSWSNLEKAAAMARTGKIFSRNNNAIVDRNDAGGFSTLEIIAQGLGFSVKDVTEHYQRKETLKALKDQEDALITEGAYLIKQYTINALSDDWTPEDGVMLNKTIDALMVMRGLEPNSIKAQQLRVEMRRRLLDKDSQDYKVNRDLVQKMLDYHSSVTEEGKDEWSASPTMRYKR